MDVTWMGHSCFRLRSEQSVLLTDPYDPDTLGLGLADVAANTVTISHEHPHHNATARVSGAFKVFRVPGEYEYMGALVKGVMTTRGPGDPPEKRNTAYHFEVEGAREGRRYGEPFRWHRGYVAPGVCGIGGLLKKNGVGRP